MIYGIPEHWILIGAAFIMGFTLGYTFGLGERVEKGFEEGLE